MNACSIKKECRNTAVYQGKNYPYFKLAKSLQSYLYLQNTSKCRLLHLTEHGKQNIENI